MTPTTSAIQAAVLPGSGTAGTSGGSARPTAPSTTIEREQHGLEREHRPDGRRPLQLGDHRQREHRASHGQGRRSGEGHQAVHPDQEAGSHQPVDAEQRGHRGERRPDQHRARVAAARARHRQDDGGGGGEAGADAEREEVEPAGDLDLCRPEEVDNGSGHDGAGRQKGEQGDGPLTKEAGHCRHYRMPPGTS